MNASDAPTARGSDALIGVEIQPVPAPAHRIEFQDAAAQDVSSLALTPSPRTTRQILIIISSLMLTFTGCGLNFAFGVYQELYETLDGPFAGASPAEIDLIGTLSVSLMTMGAPFASSWTKQYGPRRVTLCGGVLFAVANVAASFGRELWHFALAQGLLLGCATCLTYIPSVTVAPGWFDGRRGLAMGIILSGTGLGGVAWAPLLRFLNASIGFRTTLRVTGVIAFVLITASAWVLRWEPAADAQRLRQTQPSRNGGRSYFQRANWTIVRSRAFAAHATAAVLQAAAYYTPVYFFSSYATTLGYSAAAGANFIALSNAMNFSGKIVIGYLADRYGRINALVLCTLVSALVTFGLWLPSSTLLDESSKRSLFVAFTCLYGLSASAYVSLFPTALAEQFGVQNFASINGLLYMLRGVGTMVGTPIAGSLIHSQSLAKMGTIVSFEKTILMVGFFLVGATLAVTWARIEDSVRTGWKWKS